LKKSITLISAVLLFAMVGAATDQPKYEVYLGYQYVRSNTVNGNFFNQDLGIFQNVNTGFDMHGGDAQFIYNVNHWASFVVDAGGVNKPNIGIAGFNLGVSNTTAFVYGGPRFYYRRHNHGILGLQPFGHLLFGAAFRHLGTDINAVTVVETPNIPIATPTVVLGNLFPGPLALVNARLTNSDNAFSMKVGGGLDYRFNKHFSVRALEVDYILTRFPAIFTGVRANQNNLGASAGIIFTWGAM
jgi:hypothetical protein